MKQYVIDELHYADYEKTKNFFDEKYGAPRLGEIYWIPLPEALLNEIQTTHADCQPYYFAAELSETALSCELLVRSRKRIRCACIGYATEKQRNWLIEVVDAIFEKLGITV